MRRALTFDDVLIEPKLGVLSSRSLADLTTIVSTIKLSLPIISANMSTVTELDMATALALKGGLGILHRMRPISQTIADIRKFRESPLTENLPIGFSFGIQPDWFVHVDAAFNAGASIACLDVAHAHCKMALDVIDRYWELFSGKPLMVGSIATSAALFDFIAHTPEQFYPYLSFRTSIGGGSMCTTRIQTGFGVPTFQAVLNIAREKEFSAYKDIAIIADGGIRNSGDIVKAIGAGASAVMLGSVFAGTDEAPGNVIRGNDGKLYKIYRGSASYGDKTLRNEDAKHIEGVETLVPYKGSVFNIVDDLTFGIRSGISYSGHRSLTSCCGAVTFIEVTSNGLVENRPHGLN